MKLSKLILFSLLTPFLLSCGPSEENQLEFFKTKSEYELELKKIEKGYLLQEADLDSDGTKEKFYIINNKIALVEGNGKSALELLKEK